VKEEKMQKKHNLKNQLLLDLIMLPVSLFMIIDYSLLIAAGDDSLRRKIVLTVWIIAAIGWSIKFVFDLKKKKA